MSIKDFQIIGLLGQGSYSSVFKAKRLIDREVYAIKKVKLNSLTEKQRVNALNQVRILASFRHPNIVGYREAFIDQASNSLCIVMEYLDGGDLAHRIKQQDKKGQFFTQSFIWNIFLQIVKGLEALHKGNILHRDIKSANVFLSQNGEAKLGDMNVAKVAHRGFTDTQTGTPFYASPEVFKDEKYDSKSDMWSLGCVLYELVTLKPPFVAQDMQGLFKKVVRGNFNRLPPVFSTDLSIIVRCLLKTQPQQRPSCSELLQMECCRKKLQGNLTREPAEKPKLLKTIKIAKDMTSLSVSMPKANYSPHRYHEGIQQRLKSLNTIEEEAGATYTSIPQLKQQIKKKIKQTQAIKRQLVKLLEYKEREEIPRLNKSLEVKSRKKVEIELPPILKNQGKRVGRFG